MVRTGAVHSRELVYMTRSRLKLPQEIDGSDTANMYPIKLYYFTSVFKAFPNVEEVRNHLSGELYGPPLGGDYSIILAWGDVIERGCAAGQKIRAYDIFTYSLGKNFANEDWKELNPDIKVTTLPRTFSDEPPVICDVGVQILNTENNFRRECSNLTQYLHGFPDIGELMREIQKP